MYKQRVRKPRTFKITCKILTMVMRNVRLSFLCVFASFSRRKFIHIFTADFQLCYGRLHMSSPGLTVGLTRLYGALGSEQGRVGETGWKTLLVFHPSLPVGRDEKRVPLKTPAWEARIWQEQDRLPHEVVCR